MAPLCPEEVDVFTVPHSRMKELVYNYLDMLPTTNFSNEHHLKELLENLCKTFREFIAHEQIENKFIMKKLKNKLRSLSIQNTAVCNCHKDNQLTDMLTLLEDGYKCTKKSVADRINYGIKLRGALETFTETFLPHMAEEEEVFQPLLMQHFSVEELKQIKATVIQQHFKVEAEEEKPEQMVQEKFVQDNRSCKVVGKKTVETPDTSLGIGNMPNELMLKIMSNLNPQDLCRCAQVSKRWNQLAMNGFLWTEMYPVSWAYGDWDAQHGVYEEDSQDLSEKLENKPHDEDADVDETETWDAETIQIQKQSAMLTSMCRHLLPRVGPYIKHCDLAYSKGITNGTLYKILSLCPNLTYLDLTQTRVSDLGFKGLEQQGRGQKLRHVDLSGCLYITDKTLHRISAAIGQIPCHMTEEPPGGETEKCDAENPEVERFSKLLEDENEDFKAKTDCKQDERSDTEEVERCWEDDEKLDLFCGGVGRGPNCWETCKYADYCCHGKANGQAFKGQDCWFVDNGIKAEYLNGEKCCRLVMKANYRGAIIPEVDIGDLKVFNKGTNVLEGSALCQTFSVQRDPMSRTSGDTGTLHGYTKEVPGCHGNKSDEHGHNRLNLGAGKADTVIKECAGQTDLSDLLLRPSAGPALPTVEEGKDSREMGVADSPGVGTDGTECERDTDNVTAGRWLEYLSLSGCYQVTDEGLEYLSSDGGLPHLQYLDLSGCVNLSGEAVSQLVESCGSLGPAQLFYCDNIQDGPYADTASGCLNLQCATRVCCRCGE